MTTQDQVLSFVQAAFSADRARMRNLALQIASRQRNQRIASSIRRIVDSYPLELLPLSAKCKDRVLPLQPRKLSDLYLAPETLGRIGRVLEEQHARDALIEAGLFPASRILLHGPPGNGKTALASAIAGELGWPGFALNLASAIAGYLGASGANIQSAYEVAQSHKGVLLLDEIDAVASSRGPANSAAGKEWNAIVATLLKLLDEPSAGVVVAATNRLDLLDRAVLRRFEVTIEMPAPNDWQTEEFVAGLNARWGTACITPSRADSYDQLEKMVLHAAKTNVLKGLP